MLGRQVFGLAAAVPAHEGLYGAVLAGRGIEVGGYLAEGGNGDVLPRALREGGGASRRIGAKRRARFIASDSSKGTPGEGGGNGCLLTNEAIFRAAAKCSLRATAKRVWFDPDEFSVLP